MNYYCVMNKYLNYNVICIDVAPVVSGIKKIMFISALLLKPLGFQSQLNITKCFHVLHYLKKIHAELRCLCLHNRVGYSINFSQKI